LTAADLPKNPADGSKLARGNGSVNYSVRLVSDKSSDAFFHVSMASRQAGENQEKPTGNKESRMVRSWIESANRQGSDFPLDNLPYGSFRAAGQTPRCGVAIGDWVLDLAALERVLSDKPKKSRKAPYPDMDHAAQS
jgi:hypothetical protein